MPLQRTLTIVLAAALFGGAAADAKAQDAPSSRGSVKVAPRFFNPFDVGTSQITLNPFGVFNYIQPSFTAPASADRVAVEPAPVVAEDTLGVSSGGPVRPPFRPPLRSPFRPPPRPPF